MLHSLQEVGKRGFDLFHFLLNADNALLELLSNVRRAWITLALGNQNLLGLDVRNFFLLELNVVVGGTLVDNLDVGVLVAHDFVLDGALVAMLRLVLDVLVDKGVLGEDFAHEELFRQGEGLHGLLSDMNELSLGVAAKVVVSKERVWVNLMRYLEWLLLQRLLIRVEPDTDCSIEDKVHFEDFLFFVIDDILVFLVWEVARFQAESHIVQKLAVFVFLGVEEEAEVVENVVEQVVHDDAALDLAR